VTWAQEYLDALPADERAALLAFPDWQDVIEPRAPDVPLYRTLARLGYVDAWVQQGQRRVALTSLGMQLWLHADAARREREFLERFPLLRN